MPSPPSPEHHAVSTRQRPKAAELDRQSLSSERSLSVTALSSAEFCEVKHWLEASGGKVTTEAMQKGTKVHEKLEADVQERVEVPVETDEDLLAMKLIDAGSGADQLLTSGMTRELPALGELERVPFRGVIDEVRLENGESVIYGKAFPSLFLPPLRGPDRSFSPPENADYKTRPSRKPPRNAEKATVGLQLSAYRELLSQMSDPEAFVASIAQSARTKGLHLSRRLSPSVAMHAQEEVTSEGVTLRAVLWGAAKKLAEMPPPSQKLHVKYLHRDSGELLAHEGFTFDAEWLAERLSRRLKYLRGHKPPEGPDIEDAWKCRRCPFAEICPASLITPHADTGG